MVVALWCSRTRNTEQYRVATSPSKYDLKINNNRAEESGSMACHGRLVTLCTQTSAYSDSSIEEMDTLRWRERDVRKLATFLAPHYGTIYGRYMVNEHYAAYFAKSAHARTARNQNGLFPGDR